MSIYGIGAYYDGTYMTQSFVSSGCACVGWPQSDAPTLHQIIRQMKVGDIIYIKSHAPRKGLVIKAVGIVINNNVDTVIGPGEICLRVRWCWDGDVLIGKIDDKYNVRNNTVYEEFNLELQQKIISLLLRDSNPSKCQLVEDK